jgi:uncharacterized damage-inducible protein DinB
LIAKNCIRMKESQRIATLYQSVYDGSPWIDITILEVVKDIDCNDALKKIRPDFNSIWEIVNHIISWRKNVLQRVQGKILITPNHNYFETVTETSQEDWQNALKKLEESQQEWVKFLDSFDETDFEKIYPNNGMTYYEHIHGIIQHDIYHLGQIVILKKLV